MPDPIRDPAGPDFHLAEQLFEVIGRLRRRARQLSGSAWPNGRLTGAQVELVRLVRARPGITVAEAAELLAVAPNTVSTMITRLARARVLRRSVDVRDRRVTRLSLTPTAQRHFDTWHDRRAALAGEAIAHLPAASREALARAIPAIADLAAALNANPLATQADWPTDVSSEAIRPPEIERRAP